MRNKHSQIVSYSYTNTIGILNNLATVRVMKMVLPSESMQCETRGVVLLAFEGLWKREL